MAEDTSRTYLPNSKPCFVCGEENPAGLQTRFYVEDGIVKAPLRAKTHHCGYHNVVHGGVVAALMDETMGWAAARATRLMFLTAELTIRYLRPVPADRDLTVCAEVDRASKRMARVKAVLVDGDGTEYARSEGRFLPLSVDETLAVDDALLYRGGDERVFDELRASRDALNDESR